MKKKHGNHRQANPNGVSHNYSHFILYQHDKRNACHRFRSVCGNLCNNQLYEFLSFVCTFRNQHLQKQNEIMTKLNALGYPEKGDNSPLKIAKSYVNCAIGKMNN